MARKLKEYEGTFEVFDVTHRRLRNGNKLRVVLEAQYDRGEEKKLLDLIYREANVTIREVEPNPEQPALIEGEGGEQQGEILG